MWSVMRRHSSMRFTSLWLCYYLMSSSLWSRCFPLRLSKSLLESEASTMPLSPAKLPPGASEEMHAIASELPFELLNPPSMVGRDHLLEGDIAVSPEDWGTLLTQRSLLANASDAPSERKSIHLKRFFWPPDPTTGIPTVHFAFASTVTRKQMIRDAMSVWERETCVDFHEIDDGDYSRPYIRIIEGQGCWSHVGRTGRSGQQLSISETCYKEGIILHELGHAMGLFHEQSRSDRSEYIKVNFTNVKAGKEINFLKEETNNFGVPYDYSSIMHYQSTAFSKNGRPTIVTLTPAMQVYIGQRKQLSFRDITIVNHMYKCMDIWSNSCESTVTCQNGGYLGKNCACVCPPGVSGEFCQNSLQSYYPSPVCGGNITEAGTVITSPNYPNYYPADTACVWWIQSDDECKRPIITVEDFELFVRMGNGQCALDRLEIRSESIFYGDEYCGKDLREGTAVTAMGKDLVLVFSAKVSWRKGFKFTVDFTKGCLKCKATERAPYIEWQSPLYPDLYPNNQQCDLTIAPTVPKLTYVVFNNVDLPTNCHDYISINSAFGSTQRICGSRTGMRRLIGSYHTALFKSDSSTGTQGWEMSFKQVSSDCHRNIYVSSRSPRGVLTSPSYPRSHPRYVQCEWWLRAPAGRRIMLTFQVLRLSTNAYFPTRGWFRRRYYQKRCNRGYVLVSTTGDRTYNPRRRSYRICGYRNNGYRIMSSRNRLSLFFYGGAARTKGMKVIYSLV